MAFVRLDSWDAGYSRALSAYANVTVQIRNVPESLERRLRHGTAMLLATLVQLALLWAFATKLGGISVERPIETMPANVLNVFQISEQDAAEAPAAASASVAAEAAAPPQQEVDASTETELPPPEWALVRLPPQPRSRAEAAPSTRGGAGSATAGGGVYDPFAGAAPMRREETGGERSAGGFILDRAALEALLRRAARSLGGVGGTVEFLVGVSAEGVVVEAHPAGGSAGDEIGRRLAPALVGQRLFRPAAASARPRSLRLPAIELG